MKAYRPRHPAWQSINDQVASKSNKQPYCYGHYHATAILCGKCAWAETCLIAKSREEPPPPEEPDGTDQHHPTASGEKP